jgi:DNA polymerase III delta prime subunit
MNHELLNNILNRKRLEVKIRNDLIDFEKNKIEKNLSRSFYVYGKPGIGKTTFIRNVLESMEYDIIWYNSSDIRNKNFVDSIASNNLGDKSVLSMFYKNKKRIAIVMDEIDGMNNSDKGGLSSLIKLMRPKKTKKQKIEDTTNVPIICISNYHIDKKIKELIKISTSYEIKEPSSLQISELIDYLMPELDSSIIEYIINYVSGDLRKINTIYKIYNENSKILTPYLFKNVLKSKVNNEYIKDVTKKLLNERVDINNHNILINETDRTIISLLFHENVVDILDNIKFSENKNKNINNDNINKELKKIDIYLDILDNICYIDYIDRITFQKQIWIFNEISSIMKIIRNNNYLFNNVEFVKKYNPKEIRFTKILTKYSTEYNNMVFIQTLCNKLKMDKNDLISYFTDLKKTKTEQEITDLLSHLEISKLDVSRFYRLINIE